VLAVGPGTRSAGAWVDTVEVDAVEEVDAGLVVLEEAAAPDRWVVVVVGALVVVDDAANATLGVVVVEDLVVEVVT